MKKFVRLTVLALLGFATLNADAQTRSLAEVQATGAKSLTADEAKTLLSGADTTFTLSNGSIRKWTNNLDGTFTVARSGTEIDKKTGQGTWTVKENGAYCVTFDWRGGDTEKFCRLLYPVGNVYYAFRANAEPGVTSGTFVFSH